jgi:hypothetical protein
MLRTRGWTKLKNINLPFVFLDIEMPRMDGFHSYFLYLIHINSENNGFIIRQTSRYCYR